MIQIPQGFNVNSIEAIDKRFVLTKAEMLTANDNVMPDKYFAICKDDGFLYLYDKYTSEISALTGKFKQLDVSIANKVDNKSIIYLTDDGLSIKGYTDATQGQMLVKDETLGLTWINPVSTAQLDAAVASATAKAAEAGTYAINSANSAVESETQAKTAERINQQTINYVNTKFWWGTQEEYNALTELDAGTFYFIRD